MVMSPFAPRRNFLFLWAVVAKESGRSRDVIPLKPKEGLNGAPSTQSLSRDFYASC